MKERRAGLAAPINGLSLAFGTSVAGVAASAMLGLVSTLSRRERMVATRELDRKIGTTFRFFSLNHNRQETYKVLQDQARTMPEVAEKLYAMAEKLEQMGDTLGDRLLANHADHLAPTDTRCSGRGITCDTAHQHTFRSIIDAEPRSGIAVQRCQLHTQSVRDNTRRCCRCDRVFT